MFKILVRNQLRGIIKDMHSVMMEEESFLNTFQQAVLFSVNVNIPYTAFMTSFFNVHVAA